jgi:16S rRNA (guanine966-N2)-methyltransferase
LIDEIKKNKILDNNGIIIIHRHKRDDIKISKKLRIIDQRTYGISKIIIGN